MLVVFLAKKPFYMQILHFRSLNAFILAYQDVAGAIASTSIASDPFLRKFYEAFNFYRIPVCL